MQSKAVSDFDDVTESIRKVISKLMLRNPTQQRGDTASSCAFEKSTPAHNSMWSPHPPRPTRGQIGRRRKNARVRNWPLSISEFSRLTLFGREHRRILPSIPTRIGDGDRRTKQLAIKRSIDAAHPDRI